MNPAEPAAPSPPERWLLLVHQLPAKPAYARVKIWRRLQGLGAVAVKNAVYVLPASEQAHEDFAWLLKEILEAGGEGLLCEARLIDGMSDQAVRALFNGARQSDYQALAGDVRTQADAIRHGESTPAGAAAQLGRLRTRAGEIAAIDFFGADGREAVEGLLAALAGALAEVPVPPRDPAATATTDLAGLRGRVWVTRQGVQIDRIASAWLIRRCIDRDARFRFVPAKGCQLAAGELRFDMFEAEFTHEGDRCTFEVLLARADLRDPALAAIAEIVHDIDLRDAKFGRDEAAGIARLIAGIALACPDDAQRIARGSAMLDDLYESFGKRRG